ncbi:hypothetical protein MJO28_015253 [Puccinia striiformis f. sp. tritici]|uniref:Uncharacterized protein n=1 Tax=Puccinia striiformis f. sp. tritici TaxID=168172 RepID=A0ACC0DTT3_9BASI|nr:hypothetical protein MJO28_015253 [Puccinia striiformis f. sp. tritici]
MESVDSFWFKGSVLEVHRGVLQGCLSKNIWMDKGSKPSLISWVEELQFSIQPSLHSKANRTSKRNSPLISDPKTANNKESQGKNILGPPGSKDPDLHNLVGGGGGSSQIASLLGGDRQSDAMKYWVPSPIAQQSSINPVEAPSEPTSQQVACSGGRGRGIAPGDDARWLSLDTL